MDRFAQPHSWVHYTLLGWLYTIYPAVCPVTLRLWPLAVSTNETVWGWDTAVPIYCAVPTPPGACAHMRAHCTSPGMPSLRGTTSTRFSGGWYCLPARHWLPHVRSLHTCKRPPHPTPAPRREDSCAGVGACPMPARAGAAASHSTVHAPAPAFPLKAWFSSMLSAQQ